ncbi:sugar transferase [Prevotella intermedia]|uniref:Sugar transferase n=1 Tax=Prevotella intermedia TaxID=28131 RepID=A0AAJ3RJQ4_PREIN|nr:sugar transferase [Prevotella intermedia]PIK18140.1 sugar transferase [Prevotella intermedia]
MSKATHTDAMGSIQRGIKRASDFTMAALGLILLSPIFAIISVLMKCQGNGPVFFRQTRIGYKGEPFVILKFRTMSSIVEEEKPQLVAKTNCKNSTPLEQFLRGHHLDELPQLWNVLCGDMSLVGPRPERKYFIDKIMEHTDLYLVIYKMRPGLTSEATLYNGYTDTMEKMLRRLEMDISYFERRSLWLDFKIIIKTFINIVSGKKF